MRLSTPSLLAFSLTVALAYPTSKDAKFFAPSASDSSVTDLGQRTGRIRVDNVDINSLRVDPVRVLNKIARSSSQIPSLTKRRDFLLEEEDGKIEKNSRILVDPVDVDVNVIRPSPHVTPVTSQVQSKTESTPEGAGQESNHSGPKPKYIPKFRLGYDIGE